MQPGKTATAIFLNGEPAETPARTLAELVALMGLAEAQVATARNGDFVPRAARTETRIAPGDRIEVLAPRQGG